MNIDRAFIFITIAITCIAITAVWTLGADVNLPELDAFGITSSIAITLVIIAIVRRWDGRSKKKKLQKFWSLQLARFDRGLPKKNVKHSVQGMLKNFDTVTGRVGDLYDVIYYTKYVEHVRDLQKFADTMRGDDGNNDLDIANDIVGKLKKLVLGI